MGEFLLSAESGALLAGHAYCTGYLQFCFPYPLAGTLSNLDRLGAGKCQRCLPTPARLLPPFSDKPKRMRKTQFAAHANPPISGLLGGVYRAAAVFISESVFENSFGNVQNYSKRMFYILYVIS